MEVSVISELVLGQGQKWPAAKATAARHDDEHNAYGHSYPTATPIVGTCGACITADPAAPILSSMAVCTKIAG